MEHGVGAAITAVLHPLGYTRFLVQIGHEPLASEPAKSFFGFGSVKRYYPNVLKYMGHIKKQDGITGLYKGLVPRVMGGFVGTYTTSKLNKYFKSIKTEEEEAGDELVIFFKQYLVETSQEAVSRSLGIVVSQPFQVIMFRCMAQFIGCETKYSSVLSSIGEIYDKDGILGFFAGLIPRLIGEVVSLYLSNLIARLVNKYLVEDKEMKSYTAGACGFIIGTFTYRFQLIGNIMAINGADLAACRQYNLEYADWIDCWSQLSKMGQLSRGSRMFNRIAS